ncbi:MAG: hypothetical protein ABW195_17145 [Ilumatobacteraceae bacterium]
MTDAEPRVSSLVVGPDGHGVVRHALAVAAAADVAVVRSAEASGVHRAAVGDAEVVHLHFTDRLFGPDATTGGQVFGRLAESLPGRLVVTLHDVPEPTGTAHAGRRIDAYRHVARHADLLVVCSEHERRRLRQIGVDAETAVAPLPIAATAPGDRAHRPAPPGGAGRTVGVLGYLYPGKGHDAVLDAVAELPDEVAVVALGHVSVGHDDLLVELGETARRTGRRWSVTGFLDDDELVRSMRSVDVPVVPAVTTSASSSLCSWIAAGRRPLAAANGFTCEMAAIAPGLLTLYRPGSSEALRRAIARALTVPTSTWHGGAVPVRLRLDSVAAQHVALYRRVAEPR